jgi:glycosyltransferase involved in cell wall biosynthesis
VQVVLVTTSRPGGAERALASLARRLPEHGFRPVAVVLEPGPAEAWLREAGCAVVVPAPGSDVTALVRSVVRDSAAGIVLGSKWAAHLTGGPAAAAEGLPAVWWQHDVATARPGQLAAAALPAAAIACASDFALRALRPLAPATELVRIPPGVPVAALAARAGSGAVLRRSLGWYGSPLVGIVGRLQRWKAQHVFLRAAALVAARIPETRFVVVGGAEPGDPYPRRLRALARKLGLGGLVYFAGHQEDVAPWLDALDVTVHTTEGEPFGLVLVESMALGTPVVATAVGGPTEIVEDGRSGLLVPPGEPEATAAAVLRVLTDGPLARRLAAGGPSRAARFTEERTARRFAALLRTVAGT